VLSISYLSRHVSASHPSPTFCMVHGVTAQPEPPGVVDPAGNILYRTVEISDIVNGQGGSAVDVELTLPHYRRRHLLHRTISHLIAPGQARSGSEVQTSMSCYLHPPCYNHIHSQPLQSHFPPLHLSTSLIFIGYSIALLTTSHLSHHPRIFSSTKIPRLLSHPVNSLPSAAPARHQTNLHLPFN
jgi:hypothetical protein